MEPKINLTAFFLFFLLLSDCMPVNAGVEYFAAERKFQEAKTNEEKLSALYEMARTVPKHKGTENVRRELSRKIAKIKGQIEKQKTISAKRGSGDSLHVKKEGAGQIVLIGLPNSGKSHLLNKLTGIEAKEASYEFTTKNPEIGMLDFQGAKIQLVELPALIEGSSKGKANGLQVLSVARTADAVAVLASTEEEKKIILNELNNAKIYLNKSRPKIKLKLGGKGISVSGKKFLKIPLTEFIELLKTLGVHKASVLLEEEIDSAEKVIELMDKSVVYKKALFLNGLIEHDKEELAKKLFDLLKVITVYTKKPGGEVDYSKPLVLRENGTAEDAAKTLHKDFAKNLKYCRVWGSTKFPGQRVSKDYKLMDKDLIEIYV
ncbi:MAG: GTPase [Candidatus Diapherotrites archaeon]